MTTQTWSTRVRQDTDAFFREWGLELNTKLAAAGLVQTADTGQINWTTVVRAGANSEAGYEIWTLSDSLFGTAPVYFRIGYGSASASGNPRIQITVGTSTNGSGTLGGTTLTTARSINGTVAQSTDTARTSYICVAEGFFGINWKVGASASEGFFAFCRTCDSGGVFDARGAIVVWGAGASSALTATQALRFAAPAAAYTAQTSVANTSLGICAQAPTTTAVGSSNQAFLGYTITPRMEPLLGLCGVLDADVNTGISFTDTLIGATPHTYVGLSTIAGPFGPIAAGTAAGGLKFAMLYE